MADTASAPSAPASATPKKKDSAKAKKPRVKPSHPKTSDMVNAAIKNLKERGGSSLQAIKKYISSNYKVDAEKLAPFIRKYLKSAVASGSLVQTKGKGASGSFKLTDSGKSGEKKTSSTAATKVVKAKKAAKTAKKPAAASSKKAAVKSKPKAKTPKSPSKAKKAAKVPTKKPKAPKPKKAAKKPAAKKAAAGKKK